MGLNLPTTIMLLVAGSNNQKHLSLGRGGMILTDDADAAWKLKKMSHGKKLLEWLATKSNSELYTTSKPIKGFKKIKLVDLDYIINA